MEKIVALYIHNDTCLRDTVFMHVDLFVVNPGYEGVTAYHDLPWGYEGITYPRGMRS